MFDRMAEILVRGLRRVICGSRKLEIGSDIQVLVTLGWDFHREDFKITGIRTKS